MDDDLLWIQPSEKAQITQVHAALTAELRGWPDQYPPDLTHDISVARFLRGHGGLAQNAIPFMVEAIRYRSALLEDPAVRDMRAAIGDSTFSGIEQLPHYEELQDFLPNRCIRGVATDGLPISVSPIRQADLRAMAGGDDASLDAKFETFFRCTLEQRALVLHNLSVQQSRMVKFFEVRDFNAVWISEILRHGQQLLSKVRALMGALQSHYPEMLHRVIIAHAPSSFSNLFALISPVLNERMLAKVAVFPPSTPFAQLYEHLDARAIHSWHALLQRTVDWSKLLAIEVRPLPAHRTRPPPQPFPRPSHSQAGAMEATTRWLEAGEELGWSVEVRQGALTVKSRFVAAAYVPGRGGEGTYAETSEDVAARGPCEGRTRATEAGVLWLCLDNSASWVTGAKAEVKLTSAPPAQAPAPVELA